MATRIRWAGIVGAVVVLAVAVAVAVMRGSAPGSGAASDGGAPSSSEPGTPAPSGATGTATPTEYDDELAQAVMTDVSRARELDTSGLRAAAGHMVAGPWADQVHPDWGGPVAEWLPTAPIVVGDITIGPDRRTVTADLVMVLRPDSDELVLRTLAAASVLGDTAFDLRVMVDGAAIEPEVDHVGARAIVRLPISQDGRPDRLVEITVGYRIPLADEVIDDGGPAGGGLLAHSAEVTTLGHWLPVPTFDTAPMVPRGDVGAFPAAVWSLRVHHPDVLVTGGIEAPCPGDEVGCTAVVGVGLRDVSGVVVGSDLQTNEVDVEGLAVRATAPVGRTPEAVAGEAAAAAEVLAGAFGPLPWRQIDVVGVPLGHAGMEFPGMAWLDSTRWTSDGGFASYVNAHEIGHQWFHALVGNGSLSAPFLDESLAQYAAYLVFAATYGEDRATALADDQFAGRYNRAGQPGDAVCLPLDEFSSASAYGAVVYGRGGQIWVDLERAYGRERVTAVLATWIDQVGLRSGVMPADLVAAAAAAGDMDVEPALAALLLDERC